MAPKRKRSITPHSNIPTEVETRIRNGLDNLRKQSSGKAISAHNIQSQLMDPLQLEADDHLKQEILQYSFDKTKSTMDGLIPRIWQSYQQQQRAQHVFTLLDEAGKGVVVLQDLQRVAQEMLEEDVNDEDLEEMIREFDRSGMVCCIQTILCALLVWWVFRSSRRRGINTGSPHHTKMAVLTLVVRFRSDKKRWNT